MAGVFALNQALSRKDNKIIDIDRIIYGAKVLVGAGGVLAAEVGEAVGS